MLTLHTGYFLMFLLSSADIFFKYFFQKILTGTLSECQMLWIQIWIDSPGLGLNCLQRLSVELKNCCQLGLKDEHS